MNPSVALAKRNLLCYIRDRQSVLFSLMGVLIVVLLYLLFLRNMLIESYPDLPCMGNLVDVWVMSGILGIVPVTITSVCPVAGSFTCTLSTSLHTLHVSPSVIPSVTHVGSTLLKCCILCPFAAMVSCRM